MLKRYHKPNKDPSWRVLSNELDSAEESPALSGTEVAWGGERSEVGTRGRGLNLKEEEEGDMDHDWRVNEEEEEEERPLWFTPPSLLLDLAAERRRLRDRLKRLGLVWRGRVGERVKAVDCILEIWNGKWKRKENLNVVWSGKWVVSLSLSLSGASVLKFKGKNIPRVVRHQQQCLVRSGSW